MEVKYSYFNVFVYLHYTVIRSKYKYKAVKYTCCNLGKESYYSKVTLQFQFGKGNIGTEELGLFSKEDHEQCFLPS